MSAALEKPPVPEPRSGGPPGRPGPAKSAWLCLPREHGSWGMFLFPFVSAAVLARGWTFALLPALLAAVAVFLVREPIVILWRKRPAAPAARRTLWLTAAVLVVFGTWLLFIVPIVWLAMLAVAALVLTLVYVRAVIGKRQRALPLQLVGAAGLTSSAALAYLAAGRQPDLILLLLWAAQTVHYTGSVLKIHALIEARRQRPGEAADRPQKRAAVIWLAVQLGFAAAFAMAGFPLLGVALLLPCLLHGLDLRNVDDPAKRKIRLRTIGFRELGLSAAFSALTVFALW